MIKNNWINYRVEVHKHSIEKLKNNEKALELLTYGLIEEIGELMSLNKKSFIEGPPSITDVTLEIGDIFWYIAALEIYAGLPPSVGSRSIGKKINLDGSGVNLLSASMDIIDSARTIFEAILSNDLQLLQLTLSTLFTDLSVYSELVDVSVITALGWNILKLNQREREGSKFDKSKRTDFNTPKIKEEEVADDKSFVVKYHIILDNRRKQPYQGLELFTPKIDYSSRTGDLVLDFFKLNNKLKIPKNKQLVTKYSKSTHEFLGKNMDKLKLESVFLVGEEFKRISEIQSKEDKSLGNSNVRPFFIKKGWKVLDELLDYVVNSEQKLIKLNKYENIKK